MARFAEYFKNPWNYQMSPRGLIGPTSRSRGRRKINSFS